MEGIELVQRHPVDHLFDEFHWHVMPRHVQHEAAPGGLGLILDVDRRRAEGIAALRPRREPLPQSHGAVEQTARVRSFDHDSARADIQRVAFRVAVCASHIRVEDQHDCLVCRHASTGRGDFQFQLAGTREQIGEISRNRSGIDGRHDSRARAHRELPLLHLDLRRHWNHGHWPHRQVSRRERPERSRQSRRRPASSRFVVMELPLQHLFGETLTAPSGIGRGVFTENPKPMIRDMFGNALLRPEHILIEECAPRRACTRAGAI